MTTALLIIDAQNSMFAPEPVYQSERVLKTLQDLIARARAAQAPVILVRHAGRPGSAEERGTPGWELHPALEPDRANHVVDKDTPNSFLRTDLAPWLVQAGINRLVVCGMLTEYCVDTTCRAAYALGYDVVLASDGHSTIDSAHLSAEQIIAHHNDVLTRFATVVPASEVDFQAPAALPDIAGLSPDDLAAIQAGLAEWKVYDRWLSDGDVTPYWPYTHPARVADRLHQLWDPTFQLRNRYVDPPPWEMAIARTFIQPLMDTPKFIRKSAVQSVTQAFDHLLQNPRNPLSPHISQLADNLYSYDGRDVRLIYVPHVTKDQEGRERRYIFLLWAAPGVAPKNPFAL